MSITALPDEQEYNAGIAELRRYVEANDFYWQDDQTVVFNVTTAMGWMAFIIEEQQKKLDALNRTAEKEIR